MKKVETSLTDFKTNRKNQAENEDLREDESIDKDNEIEEIKH